MLISSKGRYALRVMIDLAQHESGAYLPLKEVAIRQGISEKYLESIISALTKSKLVEGMRGKGGGYKLTRPIGEYTVGSVLKATEGSLAPVACLRQTPNDCARASQCQTLPVWEELGRLIDDYLEGVTLRDLMQKGEAI